MNQISYIIWQFTIGYIRCLQNFIQEADCSIYVTGSTNVLCSPVTQRSHLFTHNRRYKTRIYYVVGQNIVQLKAKKFKIKFLYLDLYLERILKNNKQNHTGRLKVVATNLLVCLCNSFVHTIDGNCAVPCTVGFTEFASISLKYKSLLKDIKQTQCRHRFMFKNRRLN